MLKIYIPETEYYSEATNKIKHYGPYEFEIEHSLLSLSKWESKWHKSYFNDAKTEEEIIDYVRCMTITQNVDPDAYYILKSKKDILTLINTYLQDPMSATTIRKNVNESSEDTTPRKVITAEVVYVWLFQAGFPIECEKWNLNRLMTAINVYNINNAPSKSNKMTKEQTSSYYKSLNAKRRAEAMKLGMK